MQLYWDTNQWMLSTREYARFFYKKVVYKKVVNTGFLIAKKVDKFIYIKNSNFHASPSSLWFKSHIFPVFILFSAVHRMFLTWVIIFQLYMQLFTLSFSAHAKSINTWKFLIKCLQKILVLNSWKS